MNPKKSPPSDTVTEPFGPALPDSGTVFSDAAVGKTRTGALVSVRRWGDSEWSVHVGAERIIVGKSHAYALVVAEAWCCGRAYYFNADPV